MHPGFEMRLIEAALSGEASQIATDDWGSHWRMDILLTRHQKQAVVRTAWIIRSGEDRPIFVTCWVL
jgi:hypothetical protein